MLDILLARVFAEEWMLFFVLQEADDTRGGDFGVNQLPRLVPRQSMRPAQP